MRIATGGISHETSTFTTVPTTIASPEEREGFQRGREMLDNYGDALIGRETYPEVDMAPRGRECADVIHRMLSEDLKPTMALNQIPLVWGMNQVTAHPQMPQAISYLHEIESRLSVVCASIATCYPLADVPNICASVYVVTDNNQELAQACADELARWIYERGENWQLHRPFTSEAIRIAESEGRFPVIFADRDDNTGGGSPGDSTGML